MRKRVYISADYSSSDGDRDVIEVLHTWGNDNLHKVDYVDTAEVVSGSVSKDPDCRPCDLKKEFNRQINASSSVIFVIGDKTATRTAGSKCERTQKSPLECACTPYKQNVNGQKTCKVYLTLPTVDNVPFINTFSYLHHEFEQAKKSGKNIIIVYNSLIKQSNWLPAYMNDYESVAEPFWIKDSRGTRFGNYGFLKKALGYE